VKQRVLITCRQLQETIDEYRSLFSEHGIDIELPVVVQQLKESELIEIIHRFDGVIAGDDEFTARVLEQGKRLKMISKWGVGTDGIDRESAKRLGIRVSNTPDVFADEVADVVLGYVILLARRLHEIDRMVRQGQWLKIRGMSLRGKTFGVVGLGSIGRAVVKRAVALGMSVAGHDIVPVSQSFVEETGLRLLGFHELLQISDFVSLNCNLAQSNYHMLGSDEFYLMKTGAFIINTARGKLIDEGALANALEQGRIAGAALDVFEEEPLPSDSPLRRLNNCLLGSHNSSNTVDAVMRVNQIAVGNLFEGLGLLNR
jgi:D-3-phosphoglycerate dehydrogenase